MTHDHTHAHKHTHDILVLIFFAARRLSLTHLSFFFGGGRFSRATPSVPSTGAFHGLDGFWEETCARPKGKEWGQGRGTSKGTEHESQQHQEHSTGATCVGRRHGDRKRVAAFEQNLVAGTKKHTSSTTDGVRMVLQRSICSFSRNFTSRSAMVPTGAS